MTRPQASLGGLFLSPGSRGPQGLWFCPQTALGLNFTSGCHQQCGLGPVTDQPLPAFLSSSGRPRRSWRGVLWEPRLGVGRTGVLSTRRESSCLACCYCGHYHLCPRALRRERALGPRGVLLSLFIIVSQPHTHTHTGAVGGRSQCCGRCGWSCSVRVTEGTAGHG